MPKANLASRYLLSCKSEYWTFTEKQVRIKQRAEMDFLIAVAGRRKTIKFNEGI
jgi:hypothetical protein